MKTTLKIVLATAIITAIVVAMKTTKNNSERKLAKISDEGYETAHDILYPTHKFGRGKKLHYGPVLPT
jgi:hypothetical protein